MGYSDRQLKYIKRIDEIVKTEKLQGQEKKVLRNALKLLAKDPPAPIGEVFGQLNERLSWIDDHDDLFKPLNDRTKALYQNMLRDYGTGQFTNILPGIELPNEQLAEAQNEGLVRFGEAIKETDLKELYVKDCEQREKAGLPFVSFEEWNKNALGYLRMTREGNLAFNYKDKENEASDKTPASKSDFVSASKLLLFTVLFTVLLIGVVFWLLYK